MVLQAYASGEQLGIPAPRGIIVRDPEFAGDDTVGKVLVAARRQTTEVAYQVSQRNSSGTPSGAFALDSEIVSFMRIGRLKAALGAGVANPSATITIESSPDSQGALIASFNNNATPQDLGADLVNHTRS